MRFLVDPHMFYPVDARSLPAVYKFVQSAIAYQRSCWRSWWCCRPFCTRSRLTVPSFFFACLPRPKHAVQPRWSSLWAAARRRSFRQIDSQKENTYSQVALRERARIAPGPGMMKIKWRTSAYEYLGILRVWLGLLRGEMDGNDQLLNWFLA